jgi:hypothetical protein
MQFRAESTDVTINSREKANVTDHLWTLEEMVGLIDIFNL